MTYTHCHSVLNFKILEFSRRHLLLLVEVVEDLDPLNFLGTINRLDSCYIHFLLPFYFRIFEFYVWDFKKA